MRQQLCRGRPRLAFMLVVGRDQVMSRGAAAPPAAGLEARLASA